MVPTAETASLNSSLIDLIWYYMYELSNLVLSALGLTSNIAVDSSSADFLITCYESVVRWLAFDEFQIKLLKGLLFILCANIFLIYMSWKVYGKRISEKFMRPGK
jgi:glucan phosphoethanolaminetransferase (alkaline phosphatase superfamily)